VDDINTYETRRVGGCLSRDTRVPPNDRS
jgi:hypothetical protein